jgi:hypothetical protein
MTEKWPLTRFSTRAGSAQYPFYVSSSFCLLSAVLVIFCLPHIGQDTIQHEDARFRAFLESKGWDTSQLGLLHDTEGLAEQVTDTGVATEKGGEKTTLGEAAPMV